MYGGTHVGVIFGVSTCSIKYLSTGAIIAIGQTDPKYTAEQNPRPCIEYPLRRTHVGLHPFIALE